MTNTIFVIESRRAKDKRWDIDMDFLFTRKKDAEAAIKDLCDLYGGNQKFRIAKYTREEQCQSKV